MKKSTVTYHINTEKTGKIAMDFITGLSSRDDLTTEEIISVWLNINGIMERFLEMEGITINGAVNKAGKTII